MDAVGLAERYAAVGLRVGPVALSWDAEKQHIKKKPIGLGTSAKADNGLNDYSCDIREVRRLFNGANLHPGEVYGVGVRPGPNYVVLDVDTKNGVSR